mmetsp:Transcript_101082/g.231875  ORF Transcript_101082/g.231875 Transcript_101082/m.231875 type:complete len:213 (+) Transcript_101082:1439-2077(+)
MTRRAKTKAINSWPQGASTPRTAFSTVREVLGTPWEDNTVAPSRNTETYDRAKLLWPVPLSSKYSPKPPHSRSTRYQRQPAMCTMSNVKSTSDNIPKICTCLPHDPDRGDVAVSIRINLGPPHICNTQCLDRRTRVTSAPNPSSRAGNGNTTGTVKVWGSRGTAGTGSDGRWEKVTWSPGPRPWREVFTTVALSWCHMSTTVILQHTPSASG